MPQVLHAAAAGPQHAELAAMVLRWLAEDVTCLNDDIAGGKMQKLLKGLLACLPQTLPFLYQLLESNFGAALASGQAGHAAAARLHAAVVEAVLTALTAHMDWAPVPMIQQYGVLDACVHLLSSLEFRVAAIGVLKQLAARKKMQDDGEPFASTMAKLGDALTQVWDVVSTLFSLPTFSSPSSLPT